MRKMTKNELFLITETPFWVLRNTGKMEFLKKIIFHSNYHLKCHFGHQKWTSQKWGPFCHGRQAGAPEEALPVILLYYAMYQLLV